MTNPGVIRVSTVVMRDATGAVLTVRKRGTSRFMLPGGKPEPGESDAEAATRELREEIGVDLHPDALRHLGVFRAPAANEDGFQVEATVFEHAACAIDGPGAEIAELRWLDPRRPLPDDLAPLLREHVLPALRGPGTPRSVTVFTGSATGVREQYRQDVAALAAALAERGIDLVYGGGRVGLMGVLADAALDAGGTVTGVMPQALVDGEIAHTGLSRLEVVADMHERKQRMADLGEAFLALPGGAGTLEELFEVWTWQQLGIHDRPVALYDVAGFWQPLIRLVESLVDEGFLDPRYRDSLIVARTPEELLEAWAGWQPPARKWRAPDVGAAARRP